MRHPAGNVGAQADRHQPSNHATSTSLGCNRYQLTRPALLASRRMPWIAAPPHPHPPQIGHGISFPPSGSGDSGWCLPPDHIAAQRRTDVGPGGLSFRAGRGRHGPAPQRIRPNSCRARGRLRCSWPGWLSLTRAKRCSSSSRPQPSSGSFRSSWWQESSSRWGGRTACCQS